MMGVVVGDALGLPVQFTDKQEIKWNPVKTMIGYGAFYKPPGTWSDDGSLSFATLDSIREKGKVDYDDIMDRFYDWLENGKYTPTGASFDQGETCVEAIQLYHHLRNYKTCGRTAERIANGNGGLMRIMPVCLYAYEKIHSKEWTEDEALECIHQVSALTHNHLRAKIACGIYFFMVKNIIEGTGTLTERLQCGVDDAMDFYYKDLFNLTELYHYDDLLCLDELAEAKADDVGSRGYVVASLITAIWGLITTDNIEECLLKIVNLGEDSDTNAAIAGGLAGLFYGYESVPEEWRKQIANEDYLLSLCKDMDSRQE